MINKTNSNPIRFSVKTELSFMSSKLKIKELQSQSGNDQGAP